MGAEQVADKVWLCTKRLKAGSRGTRISMTGMAGSGGKPRAGLERSTKKAVAFRDCSEAIRLLRNPRGKVLTLVPRLLTVC